MSDVYVVGVGMTPFGKFPETTVKQMARDSVTLALRDAGCDVTDVGAAWFSNSGQGASEGEYSVRGDDR